LEISKEIGENHEDLKDACNSKKVKDIYIKRLNAIGDSEKFN